MGGCGPMGLGAVSYGLQFENKPKRIVVTDISDDRIGRARNVISEGTAKARGIELYYVNTANMADPVAELMKITDRHGYDDIFVYVPNKQVAELGDKLLAFDGCMNFFVDPIDNQFRAEINPYNCHYASTHIMGTTGGSTDDLIDANKLSSEAVIAAATKNLLSIPGGKKLTYTQFNMPLTALDDFEELGKADPLFKKSGNSCRRHKGFWNTEAENILFEYFKVNPKALS